MNGLDAECTPCDTNPMENELPADWNEWTREEQRAYRDAYNDEVEESDARDRAAWMEGS